MRSATARTKVVNFTSNLVSLGIFLAAGTVVLVLGLIMGAAQACGAFLGSRMVVRRGAAFVRGVLMIASSGIALYIVLDFWARR